MIKRSLLACSIAMITAQQANAAPLLPIDARGLAMGSTGVASARLAHAPLYNPALLSTAHEDADFSIALPIGGVVADEDELYDEFNSIVEDDYSNSSGNFNETIIDHFSTILEELGDQLSDDANSIGDQVSNLDNIFSGNNNVQDFVTNGDVAALSNATNTLDGSVATLQNSTADLQETTFDLTQKLDSVSGSPLRATLGANVAIAIPSKTFALALSASGTAYVSGRMFFTQRDQNLLNGYASAVNNYAGELREFTQATDNFSDQLDDLQACVNNNGAANQTCINIANGAADELTAAENALGDLKNFSQEANGEVILSTNANGDVTIQDDPELTTNVQIIAVGVAEVGLTLSSAFDISGHEVAIGLTPKLQTIRTYNYIASVEDEEIDENDVTDTEQEFSDFNLDIGAAYQFGDAKQWQVGLVARNLLSREYETESNELPNRIVNPDANDPNALSRSTQKVSLDAQFRAGLSYTNDWVTIAGDLDLAENDPVAFEKPTQYASVGAELDIFDALQLRGGYRTNLSDTDASAVSAGIGLSFGFHMDLAVVANPNNLRKELGFAVEAGVQF